MGRRKGGTAGPGGVAFEESMKVVAARMKAGSETQRAAAP
jgi:hypothetical protein